ncbi:MAG: two-component system chemotaxis response regulator CheY [Alteromonadaceae bacterium]|jgi:two-component system chemotaxis response regulator CheY
MSEEKILIVDDSRLSRMMIKGFTLATKPNWEIIEAQDANDALAKCEGENITWMTVDYNMPGMDGLTLCIELRERFPHAKIALLTANIQDSVKERADKIGVGFIQKPVTEAKVKSYLES